MSTVNRQAVRRLISASMIPRRWLIGFGRPYRLQSPGSLVICCRISISASQPLPGILCESYGARLNRRGGEDSRNPSSGGPERGGLVISETSDAISDQDMILHSTSSQKRDGMTFTSWQFGIFVAVVFGLYYLPAFRALQVQLLVVASLFFYGYGQPELLPLLAVAVFGTYLFVVLA